MSVQISAISIAISLVLGTFLGVLMSSKNKFIFFVLKICLEIVRIMPQIVWLFLFYYGASKAFGLDISKFNASLIVFSLWGVFEMMDIVRGAIVSIPRHQFESAAALALSKTQIYLYVVIPLATRRLVPAGVNLLSRIIKTTPIVSAKSRPTNDRGGEPNRQPDRAVLDIRLYIFIIFSRLLSYLKTI